MKPSPSAPLLRAILLTCALASGAGAQRPPASAKPVAVPAADSAPAAAAVPVLWQSTARSLTPNTTVEVRFPTPMVEAWGESMELEAAGRGGPLAVTPALRGRWTWRSASTGVFVASEEPARGQTYTFSVREGLTDTLGQPVPMPQPTLILKSPGLRLIHRYPTWFSRDQAPREPLLILQFNDRVNVAAAAKSLHFTDKAGIVVRAKVRAATYGDLPRGYEIAPAFRQHALALASGGGGSPTLTTDPALALPGTLVVTPAAPLPVGQEWQLVVADLPTVDGKSRLEEAQAVRLGDVPPLQISYRTAANEVGTPKHIGLRFNKQLAASTTAAEVISRVAVDPLPTSLKITYEEEWLQLAGDFKHETAYRVTLAPGLAASDGLAMDTPFAETFVFKVLTPAVALPALSVNQLAKGRAVFDVHTVNLSGVKVRVKAADRESLIYALRAYKQYENPAQEGPEENAAPGENEGGGGFARIAFDAMPGQKIYEQDFPATAAVDDQDEFVVDWRQALNGRSAGALFITVEGEARPEWPGRKRRFGAQAFVQLTDIGLAWKLTPDEAFLFAFSQATGQPLGGVTLTAFDAEKNQLATIASAADGTARLPRRNASWLLAEAGDDLHAIEFGDENAEGLGMWRFGVPYEWNPPSGASRSVSIFTERPLYLPGHTVFFKAVSRLADAAGIKKPAAAEPAVLKAYDAKGRLFHERDVQFSAGGSLDGMLELPAGVLGNYRLELVLPKLPSSAGADGTTEAAGEQGNDPPRRDVFSTYFLVEEYKPNTFQIAYDPASFKLDGEKASLALQARYLLGKPLAKARLAWSARVSRGRFDSEAFPEFEFLDNRQTYYWDEDGYHNTPGDEVETDLITAQAKTDLSDDGRAALDFTIPRAPFDGLPRDVHVTAEVTDLNQQTISESWGKTLHPTDFYLGIGRFDGLSAAGQPVGIALAAAGTDGEPWPQPVEARVTVEKVSFITVRVQTVGGGSNVKTEVQRGVVAEGAVTVRPKGLDTLAFPWTPKDPGFYYVTARATDPQGRPVESITSVQVYGDGWATWQERDGVKIDLAADQPRYAAGETAKILVKSPVAGRALVTLERRGVIKHFLTEIKGNAQVIEVPVDHSMAPNVFVSVFILRGADASPRQHPSPKYKVGFVQLNVTDARSRLEVAVASDQPAYRPGDEGSASATVTDAAGAPVAGAEVTFWAVDDGVLTLQHYAAPDLWTEFHRPQPLAVMTGTSLMHLLAESPGELAFTNKGYVIGGGGDPGAMGEKLRKNFQPVAFFHGSLVTDAAGKITVPFTVPDNLTRFRLIAVATAGDHAFGTAEGSFEINKPLMLEPSLPRFANVGDEITVKGIVLNNTDQPFEVEVALTLDTLATTTQPLVKKIMLAARGAEAVSFPLTFTSPGTAAWQWKASSLPPGPPLTDTVQSTLHVGYAQPMLREIQYATVAAGSDPANLLAGVNPELLQGQGSITLDLSNSTLVETSGALAYLLHYPYGCAEQTTSSTIPWLALHRMGDAVPGIKKSPEEVRKAIQNGANRLLSMQTTSGGLAYWPGGARAELWASTYGGMGLALARDAGAVVPAARLEQLAAYLSGTLRNAAAAVEPGDLYERAFACYTLALLGKAEPAYHDVLTRKISSLPHPARALLAMAILHSGGPRDTALKALDDPLEPSLEAWSANLFESRLTALNLLVWVRLDPSSPVTASLTGRLLKERTATGHWGSTYENAWALLALTAEAEASGRNLAASELAVHHAGQVVKVSLPARPATRSITLPVTGMPDGSTLTVTGVEAGRLRTCVTVEARPKLVPVEPRTQGLAISRTYARVAPDGTTGPADALEVGDLVAVTLNLKIPERSRYVAVDDPLPAILEAINPKFKSQVRPGAAPPAPDRELVNPWWSSHEELRQDRALFFADDVWSPGNHRITYLARVVAEGLATAPPAKIEAMYEPERYGLSGTQRLGARAAGGKVAGKQQ